MNGTRIIVNRCLISSKVWQTFIGLDGWWYSILDSDGNDIKTKSQYAICWKPIATTIWILERSNYLGSTRPQAELIFLYISSSEWCETYLSSLRNNLSYFSQTWILDHENCKLRPQHILPLSGQVRQGQGCCLLEKLNHVSLKKIHIYG